jgi:glycine oxidase
MRIAIIGAGVMGCASALALADRGADVVVLERAVPGAEASSAAAGILGAQVESHAPGPLLRTFVRAREQYAAWASALRDASGIDVGYHVSGVLRVARTADEARQLAREVAWQQKEGLRAEFCDARAARRIEPELCEDLQAAAYFPDDAQVDPKALLRALVAAASRAGVIFRAGSTVQHVIAESGRCVGVRLEDAELRADAVVLAAGSWSSLVPGVPTEVPAVRPARGQMVLLEERPPRTRTIVFGNTVYAVPRGDGRVLCGSTLEFVGYRREVTAAGVNAILSGALQILPSLGAAELAGTWSNFRPHTEGEKPLTGSSPLPGLFLATGHYRNGILLAKVTADDVARAVLG